MGLGIAREGIGLAHKTMAGKGIDGDRTARQGGPGRGTRPAFAIITLIILCASTMGCLDERGGSDVVYPPRIQFGVSSVASYRLNDSLLWDARFEIESSRATHLNGWTTLRLNLTRFGEDVGDFYSFTAGPVVRTGNLSFFYEEGVDGVPGPDYGDSFHAVGLTRADQGALLMILGDAVQGDTPIGWSTLPEAWDQPFRITLSRCTATIPNPWTLVPSVNTTVTSISPGWESVRWSALSIRPESWGSSEGHYDLTSAPHGSDPWKEVEVHFVETGIPDGLIDEGERLCIERVPGDWFGERVRVMTATSEVANITIPSTLLGFNASINLSYWRTQHWRDSLGRMLDLVYINLSSLEPAAAIIPWGSARLRVTDPEGRGLIDSQGGQKTSEYSPMKDAVGHVDADNDGLVSNGDKLLVCVGEHEVPVICASFSAAGDWLGSGSFIVCPQ